MGRKRGGRNRGYWYWVNRGWYATEGRTAVRLYGPDGEPITDPAARQGAKLAYARYLLERETRGPDSGDSMTLATICDAYLSDVGQHGSPATEELRNRLLYDFCTGLPARYRGVRDPPNSERLHPGRGTTPVRDLIPLDITRWLDVHSGWGGGTRRAAVQAVRRAICYCLEAGLITRNPIAKYKVQQVRKRAVYFTPEQEAAMYEEANEALAMAIRVCIRTGARPLSEFGRLEARHVEEHKEGQLWRFPASEHKTGHMTHADRVIYTPREIETIVRGQIEKHPRGPLFRGAKHGPWTRTSLGVAFRRMRKRLLGKGVELDDDACMYACRHTYAKRMLGGFWGPAVTLEVLAGLMGNSPKVCWEHYAKWCASYSEPFWRAIRP